MTRLVTILFIVGLASCQNNVPIETEIAEPATDSITADTNTIENEPESSITEILTCDCPTKKYRWPHSHDVAFRNVSSKQKEEQEKFERWSNDTARLQVTSIELKYYDTIPDKFKVFENVEKVIIENVRDKSLYGLDIFPNLKQVIFWGCRVILDPKANWLKSVEHFRAEKSEIIGLTDFSLLPNLRVLYMAYSGFDQFPENIESLKCLSELTFGAYRDTLDLSEIDISKLPCLKKLTLQTWYNTLTGLPQGLENSRLEKLHIHHQQLTEKEIETIKLASRRQ